ncbi:hypothetical protein IFM89_014474 [Coptis chinensis]|uniref:SAM-dependent methyltransferase TRM5/TYW2-type domain-containing protein n=1 Tax=Coptis chinensis TaxID=261450 RepID=A0A835LVR2_9MAGN|nr:hypothetical protein IFM89_014474 [Coptis chinensis]
MYMSSKLVHCCHQLSFTVSIKNCFIRKPLFPKYFLLNPYCTISSNPTLSIHNEFIYGPSIYKGRKPSKVEEEEEEDDSIIDKESFSRVFDIAAIRVPAEDCFSLESQLRGHLLNWPRIRNIARVPGDEMESGFKKLLPEKNSQEENFDLLNRRIYGKAEGDGDDLSPVLYRDKLVKSFNTRGYVKFSNLAKISRPKKKMKKNVVMENEGLKGDKGIGKNDICMVEVVVNRYREEDDMAGLLDDDFEGGKWRGSTRLLLLDERFAGKEANELPEAIKVLLKEGVKLGQICELVTCRLTLLYNYWQMSEILEGLLPKGLIVPTAFEMVGHIAHLNLREEHLPFKKTIAQVVLDKNKPKIKTVVNKIDSIQNDYRTMQLEVLAGNHSLMTTVVENGFRFHVDLATVYVFYTYMPIEL